MQQILIITAYYLVIINILHICKFVSCRKNYIISRIDMASVVQPKMIAGREDCLY